jgi:predicted HTH transcriptional regulator
MTLAPLQQLIADSKGEWEQIEFKRTTGELQGGMETLCGFLNGSGGKVLFGVTNAGKVLGQEVADSTFQEVANAIRKLEPRAWIEQVRVPVDALKEVLVLEAAQQADGPYTFDGRPYQRIGNTTSRMPQAEYQRRLLARALARDRWENQPAAGYGEADLDREEIERTVRAAVHCGRLESQPADPLELLDRLHLRAGQPEPEFEEQAGAVLVRFRPSSYHPPLRASHDLTDRQRRILQVLADGTKRRFAEIYEALADAPPKQTLQAELRMLRDLKLVDLQGHGGAARWWLHRLGE